MSSRSSNAHTISKPANAPIKKKAHQRKHERSLSPPKSLLQPHSVNALRATVNARLASGTQIINPLGHASAIGVTSKGTITSTGTSASGKPTSESIEYLPGGVPVNKQSADLAAQESAIADASMPGFYCPTCRVLSTNQSSYLDHLNSKKHQLALGHSMKVARVSLSEVQQKLHDIEDESVRAASLKDKELKDTLAEKWRLEEEAEQEAKRLKKMFKKQQKADKAPSRSPAHEPSLLADGEEDDWQTAMQASGFHFSSFGSSAK